MGRFKQFSRDTVIEKAMPLFWAAGFARTSLHDLERATGVNKSGLYSEFKDKEDLFLACLRQYYETRVGRMILSAEPLGWDNVREFLERAPSREVGRSGCFAVNSFRELAALPPQAREEVSDNHEFMKDLIARNVEAERPGCDASAVAEVIMLFFSGLCIECNLAVQPERSPAVERFIDLLRTS